MARNDNGSDLSCATGENQPPEQKNNVYDETRTSFDGQLICGLGARTCALTFLLVFALSVAWHVEMVHCGIEGAWAFCSRSSVPCSDSHLCSLLSPGSYTKAFEPLTKNRPDILTCCRGENLHKLQHCAGCGVYRPPRCTRCCVSERRPPLPLDRHLH